MAIAGAGAQNGQRSIQPNIVGICITITMIPVDSWQSMSASDKDKTLFAALTVLEPFLDVRVNRTPTVTEINYAREVASTAIGSGTFLRAGAAGLVGTLLAISAFFLDYSLFVRLILGTAILLISFQLGRRLTLRAITNAAWQDRNVFQQLWDAGVVAIAVSDEFEHLKGVYSSKFGTPRWQDVVLAVCGHPTLMESTAESKEANLIRTLANLPENSR
ncbi:hypothetical protein [Cupriavidus sp. TMH.W2]|uniref:hypothetical protein n=1 Tax=Cupriavidus sp. TMH.W2 TaxID=3434465 RepID=UPI003D76FFFA